MSRLAWPLISAVVLLGCSGASTSGAMRVTVELEAGLSSRCAKVLARGAMERESGPVLLSGRSRFVVGVTQGPERREAELEAVGFSDEGCTVPTVPAERSDVVVAGFADSLVEVTLRLRRQPASDGGMDGGAGDGGTDAGFVDRDGDGFPAGQDCDDDDFDIKPGAAELCFDSVDNDCDALTDCQDLASCGGMTCSPTGTCVGTLCSARTEVGLCADGLDNDGDGLVDCADLADCPQGATCSDQNACTQGDTCGAAGAGCQKASDKVCELVPAVQCFTPVGACLPDAGGACSYAVTTGACSDGLACTLSDTCRSDGGCAGTQKVCNTPPGACFSTTGQCQESLDGGCTYAALAAGSGTCSDGNNCTTSDRCDGDGGCRGSTVTCTPPDECRQWAGTCQGDGTCNFTVRTGQSCGDGGWSCSAAGSCVAPTPAFPYTPSNFTTAQLPTESPALTLNCNVNLDTAQSDGGVGWTTCGGGAARPSFTVISVGGTPTVLFFVESLTLNTGATLRATGARPAIFAVRNAATINGTIDFGSTPTFRGAGSETSCGSGTGQNGSASGTPETGGGAGGGGFGSDGADGSDAEGGGAKGAKGSASGSAASLAPLRGGCRGGHGGRFDSTGAANSGRGGWGGGALQISSGATLTLNTGGVITARGAGGGGGVAAERIGGGGGGSGGGILLEGVQVRVNAGAFVTANGGAGGEGSGTALAGSTGGDGSDLSGLRAFTLDVGCGGNGGQGAALAGAATTGGGIETGTCNQVSNKPGGGGGGGVGHIRFRATSGCTVNGGAVVSPAQTGVGTNCQ